MLHGCNDAATFVVRDADGLESFACDAHATAPDWKHRTPIRVWFAAADLPLPPEGRRCLAIMEEGPSTRRGAAQ